jgi:putative ABC transport system permease protein
MTSWGHALQELGRRRGRSLLSLLSVAIAVAAIVAVTSAAATTRKAYQQVFEALSGRADLEVVARGNARFKQSTGDAIRQVPGVRSVVPVLHRATIVYAHGTKAKVLAIGIVPDEPESYSGFQITEGHLPAAPDEVAMEAELAAGLKIKVGDEIKLLTARGLRVHKMAGLLAVENAARLQQGGMLLSPLDHLGRVFKSVGEVDALNLILDNPKHAPQIMAEVAPLLPEELRVRVPASRSGLAEETLLLTEVSLDLASALSFTTAVFIALSVFLMNVGERRRQLSILRALGATRKQVVGMVCREALLMGAFGTLIGVPIGIYGSRFMIRSMGAMLQATLPEVPDLGWPLVASALVGPAICLLAAWYPARKASQVSPLEGMRPVVTLEPHRGNRATTAAGLGGLLTTAFMAVGSALGYIPIWAAIGGVILSLVSVVLLLPMALSPGVRALAWPLRRMLSVEGEMSERMVLRHSGRSALTIGVLLIAVAACIGTSNAVFSITDDVRTWYERTITADFLVRAMMPDASGQDATSIPESLGAEIAKIPGIDKVEGVRLLRIEANGLDAMMIARDFSNYTEAPLDVVFGDRAEALDLLRQGEVVVSSVLAERMHVRAGDTLKVVYGDQGLSLKVAAVATEYSFGGSVVSADLGVIRRLLKVEGVDSFLIKASPDRPAEMEPKLRALADSNGLLVQSFGELLRLIDAMVAGVTGGLWVMLTLGLVVGSMGVINTLMMNVLEQTRELGMLRAIGMRKVQVVKTVLGQAAFLGLLGILAGTITGTCLARMINLCLGSMFGHYVPFALRPQITALLLVVALTVVLLAALVPARRAAGLSAIQAMRYE